MPFARNQTALDKYNDYVLYHEEPKMPEEFEKWCSNNPVRKVSTTKVFLILFNKVEVELTYNPDKNEPILMQSIDFKTRLNDCHIGLYPEYTYWPFSTFDELDKAIKLLNLRYKQMKENVKLLKVTGDFNE